MIMNNKGRWSYRGGINPQVVPFSTTIDVAPHSETDRLTYTVPPGKSAVLVEIGVSMHVSSAPSAPATAETRLRHVNNENRTIDLVRLAANTAVTLIFPSQCIKYGLPLMSGEQVIASTSNVSTGGTTIHNINVAIIEFDIPR